MIICNLNTKNTNSEIIIFDNLLWSISKCNSLQYIYIYAANNLFESSLNALEKVIRDWTGNKMKICIQIPNTLTNTNKSGCDTIKKICRSF